MCRLTSCKFSTLRCISGEFDRVCPRSVQNGSIFGAYRNCIRYFPHHAKLVKISLRQRDSPRNEMNQAFVEIDVVLFSQADCIWFGKWPVQGQTSYHVHFSILLLVTRSTNVAKSSSSLVGFELSWGDLSRQSGVQKRSFLTLKLGYLTSLSYM